jgi:uncharacterized protein (DUF1330 family)
MAAYLVMHNRIRDGRTLDAYIPKALETMAPYQPEVLVLDENTEVLEGSVSLPRTIVIKFKSRADATAWYNSPEYRSVLPFRLEATEGFAVLVDGLAPADTEAG